MSSFKVLLRYVFLVFLTLTTGFGCVSEEARQEPSDRPTASHAANKSRLTLEAPPEVPPLWELLSLADGGYLLEITKEAHQWVRRQRVIVPPGKNLLIGPRYFRAGALSAADDLRGARLEIDGREVSLRPYRLTQPADYLFGLEMQSDIGHGRWQMSQYPIMVVDPAPGEHHVKITGRLYGKGEQITWIDDIDLKVRPYLRNTFAMAQGPLPAFPVVEGKIRIGGDVVVIRNGTLIDGKGSEALEDALIVLSGERIAALGRAEDFNVIDAVQTIDAQGGYLIPGLINTHIHYSADMLRDPRGWLVDGVTTMVDVGGKPLVVFSAREVLAHSEDPMPDLMVAGPILTVPKSIIVSNFGEAGFYQVGDVDEAAQAAKASIRDGANLIKIAFSRDPEQRTLSLEQVRAVVQVAHQAGLRVMAHVEKEEDIDRAIDGGVDTITHFADISDQTAMRLVQSGIYSVPTLSILRRWVRRRVISDLNYMLAKGARIAVGNDFPHSQRGLPMRELLALADTGMTPAEILQSATRVSAEAVGIDAFVGTLEAGKIADIVVLEKNPLLDIKALEDIRMVIKRGRLVELKP